MIREREECVQAHARAADPPLMKGGENMGERLEDTRCGDD